jgi:hypothetical protein
MRHAARTAALIVSILLACYAAAAPLCDLSCSFMQLQSQCGDADGAQHSPMPEMNMSGDVNMDMPGMTMPDAEPVSSPASPQSGQHLPTHPQKSPTPCVHSSCAQASISSNSKTIHRDTRSMPLMAPSRTVVARYLSIPAHVASPPPEIPPLLSASSPLRI